MNMNITADEVRLIQKAVEVKRLVPSVGFSPTDAMIMVGMEQQAASTLDYVDKFNSTWRGYNQSYDLPVFAQERDSKFSRFKELWRKTERMPKQAGKKEIAACMLLVGYTHEEAVIRKPQKFYGQCRRFAAEMKKLSPIENAASIDTTTTASETAPVSRYTESDMFIEVPDIDAEDQGEDDDLGDVRVPRAFTFGQSPAMSALSALTPFTQVRSPTSTPGVEETDADTVSRSPTSARPHWFYDDADVLPIAPGVLVEDARSPTSSPSISLSKAGQDSRRIFERMTVGKVGRMGAVAAHRHRQIDEEFKANCKAMFKVATTLFKSVVDDETTLKSLSSAEKVADAINNLYGIEYLSGAAIRAGVSKGLTGKSPPRRGAPSRLSNIAFENLATLIFTMNSIDQANCNKQQNRQELISLIDKVVNDKMVSMDLPPMDGVHLYKRIERRNARIQELGHLDPREARRVLWLCYQNQKKHYENWEKFVVADGFARYPNNDEERDRLGHVVFFDEKLRDLINYDEMKLSLCGKGQEQSGRQAMVPSNKSMPKSGHSEDKSSKEVTVCVGVNFADEVLPLLIIAPSKAKPGNQRLKYDMAMPFHQLKGKYGFERVHHVDCEFAFSPKGSMTKDIHRVYHRKVIRPLYPRAQDIVGHKVCTKADSGPGRDDSQFIFDATASGLVHVAGLPNGTEVGQECDQLFGEYKSIMEKNRDTLYHAKQATNSGEVGYNDLGYIIFGGVVPLVNGTTVELRNAVAEGLKPEHIRTAREKCGYCPATRAALKSNRIRHEVIETTDGEIDEEADPVGALYLSFEKDNNAAVNELVNEGFALAAECRQSIKRVTANQVAGRTITETVPGSRLRQDLLARCSSAGQHFRITGGGGVINQTDMLIGTVRIQMADDAVLLAKRKEASAEWDVAKQLGEGVLQTKGAGRYKTWRKDEMRWVITWMLGGGVSDGNTIPPAGASKAVHTKFYEDYCKERLESGNFPAVAWTDADEAELDRLESGDVGDLDQTGLMKEAFEREEEFLGTRLNVLPVKRVRAILSTVDPSVLEYVLNSNVVNEQGDHE